MAVSALSSCAHIHACMHTLPPFYICLSFLSISLAEVMRTWGHSDIVWSNFQAPNARAECVCIFPHWTVHKYEENIHTYIKSERTGLRKSFDMCFIPCTSTPCAPPPPLLRMGGNYKFTPPCSKANYQTSGGPCTTEDQGQNYARRRLGGVKEP